MVTVISMACCWWFPTRTQGHGSQLTWWIASVTLLYVFATQLTQRYGVRHPLTNDKLKAKCLICVWENSFYFHVLSEVGWIIHLILQYVTKGSLQMNYYVVMHELFPHTFSGFSLQHKYYFEVVSIILSRSWSTMGQLNINRQQCMAAKSHLIKQQHSP